MAKKNLGNIPAINDITTEVLDGQQSFVDTDSKKTQASASDNKQTQETAKRSRKTYTADELTEMIKNNDTNKPIRMNMAFDIENYEYIKIMSTITGQSQTEFVNDLLRKSIEANKDIYEQAKMFRSSIKGV